MKSYASRSHTEMKDVLMNPDSSGPEIHYYMIRGGNDKTNITVWESGVVGNEYIKTYGHYHVGNLEETYTVLQGEGIIILQGKIVDDGVETFKAIKVKAGDKVHIPKNTPSAHINLSNHPSSVLALASHSWKPNDNEMQNISFDDYDWRGEKFSPISPFHTTIYIFPNFFLP